MSIDKLNEAFGLTEKDIATFDRKQHKRTRPEWLRKARKRAHESRRRNRK